jgi:hypothetical protein
MFWNQQITSLFENVIFTSPSLNQISTLERDLENSINSLNPLKIVNKKQTLKIFEKDVSIPIEGCQLNNTFKIVFEIKTNKNDYGGSYKTKFLLSVITQNGNELSSDEKITISSDLFDTNDFIKNYKKPIILEILITKLHNLYDSGNYFICSKCFDLFDGKKSECDECTSPEGC